MPTDLLNDAQLRAAGGWQAIQDARRMVDLGAVRSLDRSGQADGILSGNVLVGGVERRVILRWKSAQDVATACGCPAARRGLVCAHGLALGIVARVSPAAADPTDAKNFKQAINVKTDSATTGKAGGAGVSDLRRVRVLAPQNLRKNFEKNSLPVLFQVSDENVNNLTVGAGMLLDWINAKVGRVGAVPPALRLEGALAGEFLTWLAPLAAEIGAPDGAWLVEDVPWRPVFDVVARDAGQVCLIARASRDLVNGPGGWLASLESGVQVLRPQPAWDRLPHGLARDLADCARSGGEVVLAMEEFVRHGLDLASVVELTGDHPGFTILELSPHIRLELDGTSSELTARMEAIYADTDPVVLPASAADVGSFPRPTRGDPRVFVDRQTTAEVIALELLVHWGFRPVDNERCLFKMRGENNVLTFYASLARLVPETWEILTGERWRRATQGIETTRFAFSGQSSGPGWLEGEITCTGTSGTHISRADIHRLLRGGRGHFHAINGKKIVVDLGQAAELEEVWRDIGADQTGPGRFRFPANQQAYVESMLGRPPDDAVPELDEALAGEAFLRLRPYQRLGVAWLAGRAQHGWGGLLADDMGLGKTVQALVFLDWQRRQWGTGPAMVVCPTSLLATWRDEVARFLPGWQVLVMHGQARKDYWEVMDAADIVLTTYALLARDMDRYKDRRFRAVVLDEASLIRNPDSQGAKAVHALSADCRVALTGTPVENSVRDLWSIFQFVQPGYLGRRDDFRQRFEQPVAAGDAATCARLQQRLRPLLLRRLKSEVAADLPAKIENTSWCTLDDTQAALYNAILRESRDKLSQSIARDGFAKNRMHVLTALLRLRQVCCDPGLVFDQDGTPGGGAKRELFRELLREAVEGGHRVLVFSQFVGMLERLREDVAALGVSCGWLTGSSVDRGQQVRDFQDGKQPVFLLSLKAGGYGLTLTAADTVILYDPWWNPAVEAQAIDRAHRIGQAKVVTAYRLAARGTVEEKILRLQEKKRTIANQTLTASVGLESLDDTALRELLEI